MVWVCMTPMTGASRLDEFTTGFDRGEDPKKMEKKSLGPKMQLGEVGRRARPEVCQKNSKNPLNMIVEEIQIDVRLFFFGGGIVFIPCNSKDRMWMLA